MDLLYSGGPSYNSCIYRKNPHAAISAFRDPILRHHLLVIKTSHAGSYPAESGLIINLCADMENVLLIDADLSETDMSRLFSCCDLYISPHRAEGLGISLLLADAAGISSVITDYSGMLDYMPRGPGLHLRASFTRIQLRSPIYERILGSRSCTWAEVNQFDLLRDIIACIAYERQNSDGYFSRKLQSDEPRCSDPGSIVSVITRLLIVNHSGGIAFVPFIRRLLRYWVGKLFRIGGRLFLAPLKA